jgi:hypothetical protein
MDGTFQSHPLGLVVNETFHNRRQKTHEAQITKTNSDHITTLDRPIICNSESTKKTMR